MKRKLVVACVIVFLGTLGALGIAWRPASHRHLPFQTPQWLGAGDWTVDALYTKSANPIVLQYLVIARKEPRLTHINVRNLDSDLLKVTSVNAKQIGAYQVYDIVFALTPKLQSGKERIRLHLQTAYWSANVFVGTADVLSPRDEVNWLMCTGGSLGTQGFFKSKHFIWASYNNVSKFPVRLLGMKQAGNFKITSLSYIPKATAVGSVHSDTIPIAAHPLSRDGVVVLPGKSISVFANVSLGLQGGNAYFQPGLILSAGSKLGTEIFSESANQWTSMFIPGQHTGLSIVRIASTNSELNLGAGATPM